MTIHAVVYSRPNCPKCKLTIKQFEKVMRIKHEQLFEDNDEWSERKIQKFRDQGYGAFPVVRIYNDDTGERLDDWCDFRPDKLHKYKNLAEELNPRKSEDE